MKTEVSPEMVLRVSRILVLATCVLSTVMYAVVVVMAVYQGDLKAMKEGLWVMPHPMQRPFQLAMIVAAASALGALWFAGDILKGRIRATRGDQVYALLKTRTVVQAALLESVAIFGLVLAFVEKPAPLALTAALFAVPLFGAILIFPSKEAWDALVA